MKRLIFICILLLSLFGANANTAKLLKPMINNETLKSEIVESGFNPAMHTDEQPQHQRLADNASTAFPESVAGTYMSFGYTTATIAARYWSEIVQENDCDIRISNLMGQQTTVTGRYDRARGVVSISPQVLFTDPEVGSFTCYVCDIEKKAYYPNRDIEFVIQPDGTLLTGNWGAFVTSGPNAGKAVIHYREELFPAKATMTDYSERKEGEEAVNTYPVVFIRENPNRILIKNFYNYGADVVMTLDSVGNVKVARTAIAAALSSTGSTTNYYNYWVSKYTSPSSMTLSTAGTPGVWEGNKIRLERWAVSSSTAASGIYDVLTSSEIVLPEEFMPISSRLYFKGTGTADDPYLITSADDLSVLSTAVNYAGVYTKNKKAFQGVYFKQSKDIDMSTIPNFEPIGLTTASTFCGIYDGDGHTIANLTVNRRNEAIGGLFGYVGKEGAVRNINFSNPSITTSLNKIGVASADCSGIIENIHVTGAALGSGSVMGGISALVSGRISDCSFDGSISGNSTLGGIVGQLNGNMERCISYGSLLVKAKSSITGGLVGTAAGDTIYIRDCQFYGDITDKQGSSTLGGISGYFQLGRIESSLSGGSIYSKSVSGNTTRIGGITGLLSAGTVADCISTGWYTCPDGVAMGGLVGYVTKRAGSGVDEPKIENSVVAALLNFPVAQTGNEFIGETLPQLTMSGNIFDKQISNRNSSEGGMLTSEMATGDKVGFLSQDKWKFAKGSYPVPASIAVTDGGALAAAPFILDKKDHVGSVKNGFTISTTGGIEWHLIKDGYFSKEGHGLAIDGTDVKITSTTVRTDTLIAVKGSNMLKIAILKVTPKEYEGEGTSESPYMIKGKEDILRLANAVDMQGVRYTDIWFRLANDIDMGGNSGFYGFSSQGKDGAFNGIFDGNGHSVKNWIVDRVGLQNGVPTVSGASSLMAGFFLYTGPESRIMNLTIDESCSVIAGNHVAALVSQNNGVIENCRNHAYVAGLLDEVGGIVASNNAGGTVTNCYNSGRIDCARANAGGIAGYNRGLLTACQNDGLVANDSIYGQKPNYALMGYAGSVAGINTGTISQCLGAGNVYGNKYIGGIAGHNKDGGHIEASMVYGVVESSDPSKWGAAMGSQGNANDTVTSVYYDLQLAAPNAADNISLAGVYPLATSEMISGCLPSGLDNRIWSVAEGRYPQLKAFATEPASGFNANTIVKFSDTSDRLDKRTYMRSTATVSLPADASASISGGKLTIDNLKISIPAGVRGLSDTLLINNGKYEKRIPIFAPGAILAKGDGSKETPWVIETPADWNSIADYHFDYGTTFKDENFILGSDLNFKDTDFRAIANSGKLNFEGSLDGASHKIINLLLESETTNVGLFGVVGEYGEVKNLQIDPSCEIYGRTNVGAITGSNAGIIHNCTNSAKIVRASNSYAGGIAGYAIAGARFIECENNADITCANGQAGGIVGGNGADIGGLVQNCTNRGKISSDTRSAGGLVGSGRLQIRKGANYGEVTTKEGYAGGIAGYHTWQDLPVDSCINYGKIISGAGHAGGIIGYALAAVNVTDCENRGDISATKNYAGGIVGYLNKNNSKISNCSNYGTIFTGTTHAGGIVGYTVSGTAEETAITFTNLTNFGEVTASTSYAGGIIGQGNTFTHLRNVRNYGDVLGDIYVGGIAGATLGDIDTAANTGSVTAKRYTVGGILGTTASTATVTAFIRNALNMGQVESLGATATTCYNIGGILGGGNIKIYNCVNLADIKGYKAVGGLVGLGVKGSSTAKGTSIYDSYNAGSVECLATANAATCGHIVGLGTTPITDVEFNNVWFDKNHAGEFTFTSDSIAMAAAVTDLKASDLGEGFTDIIQGGYPIPTPLCSEPLAKVASAAIHFAEGENRHNVRSSFSLIAPDGLEWRSNDFNISGDKASWSYIPMGSKCNLTAAFGDFQRNFTLTVKSDAPSTVNKMDGENAISVEWYTLDGIKVTNPSVGTYVKLTKYADGSGKTETIIK